MSRKSIPFGATAAAEKAVHQILSEALTASMHTQQVAYSNRGEKFVCTIVKMNRNRLDAITFTLNVTNTETTSWNVSYRLDAKRGEIWQEAD